MTLDIVTNTQEWAIGLACVMMLADIVVGFVTAIINSQVSSVKMREGLLHKVLVLILIVVCLAIEIALDHAVELPCDIPTCEVVCGYVVVMEMMSILENIKKGYPQFGNSKLMQIFDLSMKEKEQPQPVNQKRS